ncbi:TM2 domain-containing protein [Synechococcus moorigangaii CMS01]|nr:TM2 domain-containing protein [Synechococcus moorigangaii CMS01]
MRQKTSAAVLAFFLGGVGVHKFYLGEIGWGIVYAVFFWTYIPTLAGFVESLLLVSMSQEHFDQKYNSKTLMGYESRQLTNRTVPPQVIVNIGDQAIATHFPQDQSNSPEDQNIAKEALERRILKFCQVKGEVTLLDCFLEIENVPKSILEAHLENLVRAEFLQMTNRATDGKIVYRLDN